MGRRDNYLAFAALAVLFSSTPAQADDATPVGGVTVSTIQSGASDSAHRVPSLDDLDKLIEQLDSPVEDDRWQAAADIGGLGKDAIGAEPALLRQLSDSEIRITVARSLLQIGADPTPLVALLNDEDKSFCVQLSNTLLEYQVGFAKTIPNALRLAADLEFVSNDPLKPFESFGPKRIAIATPILIEGLSGEQKIADQAYCALSNFIDLPDAAVPLLIELLRSTSTHVRLHATRLLCGMGDRARVALPSMRQLMDDSSDAVRSEAAAFVARMDTKDQKPIAVLTEIASRDFPEGVLSNVLVHLGEFGERSLSAVPVIIEKLGASDQWVSLCAKEALPKIGSKAIPKILDELDKAPPDPAWQRRRSILEALGAFGTTAGFGAPAVLEETESSVYEVQIASIKTLVEIEVHEVRAVGRLTALRICPT